jgi:hypothetical protein
VPRGCPGGQERRSRGGLHRRHEVIDRHLGERDLVRVRVGDQVEGDVDVTGIRRHGGGVLIDRVLVERVDLRRVGRSPRGANLPGDRLELRRCAAGEEDPGALAGERAGNGAADRPAPSVDHGVLVLEQHVYLLKSQVSQ